MQATHICRIFIEAEGMNNINIALVGLCDVRELANGLEEVGIPRY